MVESRTQVMYTNDLTKDKPSFQAGRQECLCLSTEREDKSNMGLEAEPLCLLQVAMWTINYFDIAEEFLSVGPG